MTTLPFHLFSYVGFWTFNLVLSVIFPSIQNYESSLIGLLWGSEQPVEDSTPYHLSAPEDFTSSDKEVRHEFIDYISDEYTERLDGDRLKIPHSLESEISFENIFSPRVAWTDFTFYVSYDNNYIAENSEIAHALYTQLYVYEDNHFLSDTVFGPDVFTIKRDTVNHRFYYPDGSTAILLPGSVITMKQDTSLHQVGREIKYYKHTLLPTERVGSSEYFYDRVDVLEQQKENFVKYFHGYGNYIGINKDGVVVIENKEATSISFLIKNYDISQVSGLRTLGVKKKSGDLHKAIWFEDLGGYMDPKTREGFVLEDGDVLYQLVPNNVRDVDGLVSVEYIIYDNEATGCTRTKRLNGYQFDIHMPFGSGPYETARRSRGGPAYLGKSTNQFKSIQRYMSTRNTRNELLDPESFPDGTNFVEIIFHSDSPLGKIYGHAAMMFLWNDHWRVLDPYAEVPGYGQREPKLLDDYLASQKVAWHLGIARVYYWNSGQEIVGVSLDEIWKK